MLSVAGIYDGKNIYPNHAIKDNRKYKVIITFVEELDNIEMENMNVRNFGTAHASMEFWNNPEEDIYQDYLPNADKACKQGTIVLIPFPFAELTNIKVRPAIVVSTTKDKYQDLILCAVSSVMPVSPGTFEIVIQPNKFNNLRVLSTIKIDRIVTLKKENVIAELGTLSDTEIIGFKRKFKQIVD